MSDAVKEKENAPFHEKLAVIFSCSEQNLFCKTKTAEVTILCLWSVYGCKLNLLKRLNGRRSDVILLENL